MDAAKNMDESGRMGRGGGGAGGEGGLFSQKMQLFGVREEGGRKAEREEQPMGEK